MPKNWALKVDQFFNANPNCIIATVHVDSCLEKQRGTPEFFFQAPSKIPLKTGLQP
jgi:hypothetical protein